MFYNHRNALWLDRVPRWSVIDTLRQQNVAEHSYRVMAIVDFIISKHKATSDSFYAKVMRCALFHDAHEAIDGDMPSNRKERGETPQKSDQVYWVVKAADWIEMDLFLADEIQRGNKTVLDLKFWVNDKKHRAIENLDLTVSTYEFNQDFKRECLPKYGSPAMDLELGVFYE